MAYTPYEWTVNSYVNPTRMNAIEQGIAAASQAAESAAGDFSTIEEYIGTQSIAGIGDGTLAGAIWKTNSDLTVLSETVTTLNSNLSSLTPIVANERTPYFDFGSLKSSFATNTDALKAIFNSGNTQTECFFTGKYVYDGERILYGLIYEGRKYGFIKSFLYDGSEITLVCNNGNFTIK